IYEKLIDNAVMYSEKRVMIPEPEFYVLYNGVKPFPEQTVYRLSDSYNRRNVSETALDLTVTVYNVNKGHNEDIVRRSESLYGYILLVAKAREYEQNGLERAKAVERAIKECIEQEILTEYLRNNGSEVSNMLLQEWKIEDAKAVWQREAEERSDRKWQSVILQKDAILADKDAVLADKDAEIAKLRALLDRK
ncbi:MAG: hypothetical protein FWG40_06205, partial [Peptococcaceae bacterium]|nr:hypothetical protein [Peptococcaceae bacterium]